MSSENDEVKQQSNLPVFLDPGTKGKIILYYHYYFHDLAP